MVATSNTNNRDNGRGQPSRKNLTREESSASPEPEVRSARKRSRNSVDSNFVSGPSDEEPPSQRARSPAPPPETPAHIPFNRRLRPTESRWNVFVPNEHGEPREGDVWRNEEEEKEEESENEGSPAPPPPPPPPEASAPVHQGRRVRRSPAYWNVLDFNAGPPPPSRHIPWGRKRSHDESEEEDDAFSNAEVKAERSSPSPSSSPPPAAKKRRTQEKSAKTEPSVKRERQTRARTQPQAQPTRRSQRIARQPNEARAPARAAPLEPLAAAKAAAKGKSRAAGSGAGRRRR